ncbi:MAG: TIGR01777 family oxidoreductase [Sediminibacterium sp.]
MARIVITGGTGMVGSALANILVKVGHQVTILSRKVPEKVNPAYASALWDPSRGSIDTSVLTDTDIIVNLAGANVADKRWTAARKQEILKSRVDAATTIVQALKQYPNQVKGVISASAIGWYGKDTTTSLVSGFQESDEADDSFLGDTCRQWEQSIKPIEEMNKRLVILRIGIVLDKSGGALPAFLQSLRWRVAGILGTGSQMISWIHLFDLCQMILFAIENEEIKGVFNAVSPHPVSNEQFNRKLAEYLHGDTYIKLPVPAPLLHALLGEMSIEVLKSATVSSLKIRQAGFVFRYPKLLDAFREIFPKT